MSTETIVKETSLLTDYLAIFIPAIITIIGFIINILVTQSSIRKEINKKKTDIYLEESSKVPSDILNLLNKILANKNSNSVLNDFKSLTVKIFSYGSEDAIKIISSMQQFNYQLAKEAPADTNYKLISFYILLACQVKYDLTGIKINPEYWYKLQLKDYIETSEKLISANNELVDELSLDKFLKIK